MNQAAIRETSLFAAQDEERGAYDTTPAKISLSLPRGCVAHAKWLAQKFAVPASHIARRAIDFRYALEKELENGGELYLKRTDGELVRIWFES